MRYKVAFVSCKGEPEFSPSDHLAVSALAKRGIETTLTVWNEPQEWNRWDAVILRATWDYWLYYPQFLRWLDELESRQVEVWNPVPMVRWNSNKLYLRDLAQKGVAIVPTTWVARDDFKAMEALLAQNSGTDWVLKPVISGGAYCTYRLHRSRILSAKEEWQACWVSGPGMLQPYLPVIQTEGEYSFLFFAGEFSHLILKSAASGDFRIQSTFGGTSRAVKPGAGDVEWARGVVAKLDSVPLYARVDAVRLETGWHIMELELVEPNLFFTDYPDSAGFFADKLEMALMTR